MKNAKITKMRYGAENKKSVVDPASPGCLKAVNTGLQALQGVFRMLIVGSVILCALPALAFNMGAYTVEDQEKIQYLERNIAEYHQVIEQLRTEAKSREKGRRLSDFCNELKQLEDKYISGYRLFEMATPPPAPSEPLPTWPAVEPSYYLGYYDLGADKIDSVVFEENIYKKIRAAFIQAYRNHLKEDLKLDPAVFSIHEEVEGSAAQKFEICNSDGQTIRVRYILASYSNLIVDRASGESISQEFDTDGVSFFGSIDEFPLPEGAELCPEASGRNQSEVWSDFKSIAAQLDDQYKAGEKNRVALSDLLERREYEAADSEPIQANVPLLLQETITSVCRAADASAKESLPENWGQTLIDLQREIAGELSGLTFTVEAEAKCNEGESCRKTLDTAGQKPARSMLRELLAYLWDEDQARLVNELDLALAEISDRKEFPDPNGPAGSFITRGALTYTIKKNTFLAGFGHDRNRLRTAGLLSIEKTKDGVMITDRLNNRIWLHFGMSDSGFTLKQARNKAAETGQGWRLPLTGDLTAMMDLVGDSLNQVGVVRDQPYWIADKSRRLKAFCFGEDGYCREADRKDHLMQVFQTEALALLLVKDIGTGSN